MREKEKENERDKERERERERANDKRLSVLRSHARWRSASDKNVMKFCQIKFEIKKNYDFFFLDFY